MLNDIFSNYALPQVAVDDLKRHQVQGRMVSDGVETFLPENDKGLAYRFFVTTLENKARTKAVGLIRDDEVEMIEWIIDKDNRPTERVRMLPPELLEFDEEGEVIGGKYKDSYLRFKQGAKSPGLPLTKWGVLSDGDVSALARIGIFSVEQLAATPRGKIEGKFYQDVVDAFEKAIMYVRGKDQSKGLDEAASKIISLEEQVAKLTAMLEGKSQKKGKKSDKNVEVLDGVILTEGLEEV